MGLLAIFLGELSINAFTHFQLGYFSLIIELLEFFIYSGYNPYQRYHLYFTNAILSNCLFFLSLEET